MAHSQNFETQVSGRRRKCRCEAETSAVSSQMATSQSVTFESIIEVTDHTIEAWRTINDCRVCAPQLEESSVVQTYTGFAAKLIVLYEAAIQAHPGQMGNVDSLAIPANHVKCASTPMFLGDFKLDKQQSYLLARQIIRDYLLRLSSLLQELQELCANGDHTASMDGGIESSMPRLLALLGRIAAETK